MMGYRAVVLWQWKLRSAIALMRVDEDGMAKGVHTKESG